MHATSIAFAANGDAYIAEPTQNHVLWCNPQGVIKARLGRCFLCSEGPRLNRPELVAVDSEAGLVFALAADPDHPDRRKVHGIDIPSSCFRTLGLDALLWHAQLQTSARPQRRCKAFVWSPKSAFMCLTIKWQLDHHKLHLNSFDVALCVNDD